MAAFRAGGIILAAGRSTRMGEQKLLLPWNDITIIGHIVSQAAQSALDAIVVVTGTNAEEVESVVSATAEGIRMERNPAVDDGMLSSVRVGLRALPASLDGVVLLLGDQPSVTAGLIDDLLNFAAAEHASIAVPVIDGKRGHPLYFSMQYRDDVLRDFEDIGLRGLLARYAEAVHEWPVTDDGILEDLDTPEDYKRARSDA